LEWIRRGGWRWNGLGRCGVSEDGDEGVTSGEGRQGSAVVVVKDGHEVFMELPELLGEGGVRDLGRAGRGLRLWW